jgi:dTDP-4-dehydrorhamnose 3,5-epimerase
VDIRIVPTPLEGVVIVETDVVDDERGFFMETYHRRRYFEHGITLEFVQDNHSRSRRGTLRGFHYQDMRAPTAKLVRCTHGALLDVALDLRVGSPTFGHTYALELTAANKKQLLVPVGFGHAFQALTEGAEIQYKCSSYYAPETEGVVAWDDPEISFIWPIPDPVLSGRDRAGMRLATYRQQPAFVYPPYGGSSA